MILQKATQRMAVYMPSSGHLDMRGSFLVARSIHTHGDNVVIKTTVGVGLGERGQRTLAPLANAGNV